MVGERCWLGAHEKSGEPFRARRFDLSQVAPLPLPRQYQPVAFHSWRSTSTGSVRVAIRAGLRPAAAAIASRRSATVP